MRILIVHTSAMGDVVHALPVLTALLRHLPKARIGWVVEEAMAPVLAGHPDLDEAIPVQLRHWGKSPFTRRTVRELEGAAQEVGEHRDELSGIVEQLWGLFLILCHLAVGRGGSLGARAMVLRQGEVATFGPEQPSVHDGAAPSVIEGERRRPVNGGSSTCRTPGSWRRWHRLVPRGAGATPALSR